MPIGGRGGARPGGRGPRASGSRRRQWRPVQPTTSTPASRSEGGPGRDARPDRRHDLRDPPGAARRSRPGTPSFPSSALLPIPYDGRNGEQIARPPPTSEPVRSRPRVDRIAKHIREIIRILGFRPDLDATSSTPTSASPRCTSNLLRPRRGDPPEADDLPERREVHGDGDGEGDSLLLHVLAPLRPLLRARAHRYIPNDRIVGLSKLPRLLEFFARRPAAPGAADEQVATVLDEDSAAGVNGRHRGAELC